MPTVFIEEVLIHSGDWLKITHPSLEDGGDGQVVYVRIKDTNEGISTNPNNTATAPAIKKDLIKVIYLY